MQDLRHIKCKILWWVLSSFIFHSFPWAPVGLGPIVVFSLFIPSTLFFVTLVFVLCPVVPCVVRPSISNSVKLKLSWQKPSLNCWAANLSVPQISPSMVKPLHVVLFPDCHTPNLVRLHYRHAGEAPKLIVQNPNPNLNYALNTWIIERCAMPLDSPGKVRNSLYFFLSGSGYVFGLLCALPSAEGHFGLFRTRSNDSSFYNIGLNMGIILLH